MTARTESQRRKQITKLVEAQLKWFGEFNNDLPQGIRLKPWGDVNVVNNAVVMKLQGEYGATLDNSSSTSWFDAPVPPYDQADATEFLSSHILQAVSVRRDLFSFLVMHHTVTALPLGDFPFWLRIHQQNLPNVGEKYAMRLSTILLMCFIYERKPSEALMNDPEWCLAVANQNWSRSGQVHFRKLTKPALTSFRTWYLTEQGQIN